VGRKREVAHSTSNGYSSKRKGSGDRPEKVKMGEQENKFETFKREVMHLAIAQPEGNRPWVQGVFNSAGRETKKGKVLKYTPFCIGSQLKPQGGGPAAGGKKNRGALASFGGGLRGGETELKKARPAKKTKRSRQVRGIERDWKGPKVLKKCAITNSILKGSLLTSRNARKG